MLGSAAHRLKLEQDSDTHKALGKDGTQSCAVAYILSISYLEKCCRSLKVILKSNLKY